MKSISSSIKELFCKNIFRHNKILAEIIFHWKEILEDDFTQYIYPKNIYRFDDVMVLVIGLSNSYLSTEIYYQGSIIVGKINDFFGYEVVNKIKIK